MRILQLPSVSKNHDVDVPLLFLLLTSGWRHPSLMCNLGWCSIRHFTCSAAVRRSSRLCFHRRRRRLLGALPRGRRRLRGAAAP